MPECRGPSVVRGVEHQVVQLQLVPLVSDGRRNSLDYVKWISFFYIAEVQHLAFDLLAWLR